MLLLLLLTVGFVACGEEKSGDESEHLEAMAEEHKDDTPSGNEVAWMEPAVEVKGGEVIFSTVVTGEGSGAEKSRGVSGYYALPADAGESELPGVVVIHEWWGLNDNVRAMARRIAGEGYRVLAVDMYDGEVATTPEEAKKLMGMVMGNDGAGLEAIEAGIEYLKSSHASKLGIIGWCFGGGWSLRSALTFGNNLDAAVMYYGQVKTDPAELSALEIPLLGIFGAEDEGIPVDQVERMSAVLDSLGKEVTIEIYPDATHAFANPSGQHYNGEAAVDAWRKTAAFFAVHLRK